MGGCAAPWRCPRLFQVLGQELDGEAQAQAANVTNVTNGTNGTNITNGTNATKALCSGVQSVCSVSAT